MKTQTDKTQEPQHSITPRVASESSNGGTAQLKDNRTSSISQRKLRSGMDGTGVTKQAIQKKNNTGLPDNLKSGIENLSGYSMDDVKVHYNSSKPAQLQAHAYAQGTDIHLAPGQEKHLPHEAWHVVQQKQGRVEPTRQLKSKVNINDDAGLEKEADVMGEKSLIFGKQHDKVIATQMKSNCHSTTIQTKLNTNETKVIQPKFKIYSQSLGLDVDHIEDSILHEASLLLEDEIVREQFIIGIEADEFVDLMDFVADCMTDIENKKERRGIFAMLSHVVTRLRYEDLKRNDYFNKLNESLDEYASKPKEFLGFEEGRLENNVSLFDPKMNKFFKEIEEGRISMSDTAGQGLEVNRKPLEDWRIAERLVRKEANINRQEVQKTGRLPLPGLLLVVFQKINKWLNPDQSYLKQDNDFRQPDKMFGTLRLESEKGQGEGGAHYGFQFAGPIVVKAMEDLYENIKPDQDTLEFLPHLTRAYTALISAHPFENGNGRSVRLFIDYILLLLNRPPALYDGDDYKIIHFDNPESKKTTNPKEAQEKMLRSLIHGQEEFKQI